jgi:hypothetical protein
VALRADPGGVDLGMIGQHLPGRQHVIGAGGKRELGLVGDGGRHVARAKAVEHKRRKAVGNHVSACLRCEGAMPRLPGTTITSGSFPLRLRWSEAGRNSLPVDRKPWQVGGITDDVEIVGRIGGGNFEILSLALSVGASGENNVLIAKSQVVVLLRCSFLATVRARVKRRLFPSKQMCPAVSRSFAFLMRMGNASACWRHTDAGGGDRD